MFSTYKSTGKLCSWSYGSWIYLCNQCLSPLKMWVWIPLKRGVLNTTLCDKVCQWLATGPPVSSTNKTDRYDITEILLKVALNTITLILQSQTCQKIYIPWIDWDLTISIARKTDNILIVFQIYYSYHILNILFILYVKYSVYFIRKI